MVGKTGTQKSITIENDKGFVLNTKLFHFVFPSIKIITRGQIGPNTSVMVPNHFIAAMYIHDQVVSKLHLWFLRRSCFIIIY